MVSGTVFNFSLDFTDALIKPTEFFVQPLKVLGVLVFFEQQGLQHVDFGVQLLMLLDALHVVLHCFIGALEVNLVKVLFPFRGRV